MNLRNKMESFPESKVRSVFFSRIIPIVWLISLGLVCYLSLAPKVEFPVDFSGADLLYHSLAYLWLAFLSSFVFRSRTRTILCLFSLIVLGIVLEFGQIFVPGGHFSVGDMGANSLGAILGFVSGTRWRLFLLGILGKERS